MISAILAGDSELYHGLIRPYELSVYRIGLSLMKNKSDADVAEETFLKAFRSLEDFRGQAKFSTWLISITLNEARSRFRRHVDDNPKAPRILTFALEWTGYKTRRSSSSILVFRSSCSLAARSCLRRN